MPTRLAIGLMFVLAACSPTAPITTESVPATVPPAPPMTSAPPTQPPATTTPLPTTTTVAPTTTTTTTVPLPPLRQLDYEVLATGLVRPNYVLALPGSDSLLVMLAAGTVWTLGADGIDDDPFLDLSDLVNDRGIEQGLLGMAFHPQDPSRLFAYFTDAAEDAQLVEVTATATGADPETLRTVLTVPQPANRHQAGMLLFGPDGYLYLSSGDGGDGGSQGQNPDSVLGTIVRIDVDSAVPYAIPPDNPFANGGGAPEVIAYGLRNPWRFSIDPITEVLYIGDVGQDSWEEINVVPLDLEPYNFGWPATEGAHCFQERGCDPTQFDGPTVEFSHDEGCSVTAGFVYRGRAIPEIAGQFFYSDWCGQWLRSFVYAGGDVIEPTEWPELDGFGQINSFGLDAGGELLVTTWAGDVARIVAVRQP